jgi:methyl-accepting chemotaxis protein
MTKLEETNEMIENIKELVETNEMFKSVKEIIREPGPFNEDAIREQTRTAALLDIAKSLAIIADGITAQNEQIEKIENDLDRLEHSYSSKWHQVPSRH